MGAEEPRDLVRSLLAPIGRIVETVVPTVTDAIDVDDVVRRIDVDQLVRRVDVNDLLDRVDVNELLDRVDVNELLDRVEVDRLLDRVDMDRLLDRVDVDAVVERIDVDRVLQRADLAGVVAESTRGITASTVDLVRRQIAGLDEIVTRVGARVVGRDPDADPAGPEIAIEAAARGRRPSRPSITGHYAGPIARTAAMVLDWMTMVFLFGVGTASGSWILELLVGRDGRDATPDPWWSAVLLVGWAIAYFALPLAVTGRTFGKAVVGLRVVDREGSALGPVRAFVRVLVLPVSFAFLGLGLVGAVIGRRRRTLHDVAARSVEIIDWGDRPAALPAPVSQWLTERRRGDG